MVTFYRYVLPSIRGEGWAIVVLGSDGFFATVSDYGNYSYLWSHRGEGVGIREFLLDIGADYMLRKLDPTRHFDAHATIASLSKRMGELFSNAPFALDEERGRALKDLRLVANEVDLARWHDILSLDLARALGGDWYEDVVYLPSVDVTAFVEKVLPRLKEAIATSLAQEQAPDVDGFEFLPGAPVLRTPPILPGRCRSSDDTADLELVDPTAIDLSRRGPGGLDAGSLERGTPYAIYLIGPPAGGAGQLLASLSFTRPILPDGFTVFRRVAAFYVGFADVHPFAPWAIPEPPHRDLHHVLPCSPTRPVR